MTAQEAFVLYLSGLKQLARRVAGASVEDAFIQLDAAWHAMSPTDRLLVISKGADPVTLAGGVMDAEPPTFDDWQPQRAFELPRAVDGRRRLWRTESTATAASSTSGSTSQNENLPLRSFGTPLQSLLAD